VSTLIFALNIFTGGKTLENLNHLEIQLTPKDANGKCLHIGGSQVAYTLDSVFKLGLWLVFFLDFRYFFSVVLRFFFLLLFV
jgi:hypothetical protein